MTDAPTDPVIIIQNTTIIQYDRELAYELVDVLRGGMAKLQSLTMSGDTMPFKAANDKEGGLFPTLLTAGHSQLPQLKYVYLCLVSCMVVNRSQIKRTYIESVDTPHIQGDRARRVYDFHQHLEADDCADPPDADAGAQGAMRPFVRVCII